MFEDDKQIHHGIENESKNSNELGVLSNPGGWGIPFFDVPGTLV